MNKNKIILLISVLSVLAGSLILVMMLLIFKAPGQSIEFFSLNSQCELANTSRTNITDTNKIDISYYSDPITFYESDGEELVLEEYMNWWEEPMLATVTKKDGVISIRSGERQTTRLGSLRTEIKVYLPKSYHGSLEVTVSSGKIHSEMNLSLQSAALNSTSGRILMENLSAVESITAKSSSGALDMGVLTAGTSCSLTSSSGAIRAKSIHAESLNVSASSGAIRLDEAVADTITGETSSGSISLKLDSVKDDITIETTSGKIQLELPEALEFAFEADSNSGNIRTDFDDQLSYNKRGNSVSGQIGQNSSLSIRLAASSGNIDVKR